VIFSPIIDEEQMLTGPSPGQDYERFKQAYPEEARIIEQLSPCISAMSSDMTDKGLAPGSREQVSWVLENIDKYPACDAIADDFKKDITRSTLGLQRSKPASPEL